MANVRDLHIIVIGAGMYLLGCVPNFRFRY